MGDLDSLINQAKALMGDLISKPKMNDKLLSKPPFRFLHDTISSVASTTGFGEGLYSDGELDSAAITDKNAKVAYLEKIFNLVGICKVRLLGNLLSSFVHSHLYLYSSAQGAPVDIRAAKVVSGLEPECTNLFLISLAECAADRSIDNDQAVRRCLNGEAPGQGARPLRAVTIIALMLISYVEINSLLFYGAS